MPTRPHANTTPKSGNLPLENVHIYFVEVNFDFKPRPIERRLDFVFYKTEMKIWAVGWGLGCTVLKKVWADYEQLLRLVFSTFCGQKKR